MLRRRKHAAEIVRRGVLCFFVGFLGHAAVWRASSRSSETCWLLSVQKRGRVARPSQRWPWIERLEGPTAPLIEELQYYIPRLGDARGTWRSNTQAYHVASTRVAQMAHRFATLDGLDDLAPDRARCVLTHASKDLIDHGLLDAAQWCLELLTCVPDSHVHPTSTPRLGAGDDSHRFPVHSTPALNLESPSWNAHKMPEEGAPSWTSWEHASPSGPSSRIIPSPARSMDPPTSPEASLHVKINEPIPTSFEEHFDATYMLAKTFFDRDNYHACVSLLESQPHLTDKARFLMLYARLLIFDTHPSHPNALLPLWRTRTSTIGKVPTPRSCPCYKSSYRRPTPFFFF